MNIPILLNQLSRGVISAENDIVNSTYKAYPVDGIRFRLSNAFHKYDKTHNEY